MEFLDQAIAASAAVLLVVQVLKLKVVPVPFANRYPVPTNIIVSVVATLLVYHPTLTFDNIPNVFVQVGTVATIAAIAYNQLLAKWPELKANEGA